MFGSCARRVARQAARYFAFVYCGFFALLPAAHAWSIIPDEDEGLKKAFQTGEFSLDLIMKFGFYIIQTLIELAGVVAVIMIMVGGYRYVIGSLSEDKESGKNTLKFSLIGFAVAVLSWIIVDFVITFFTTG